MAISTSVLEQDVTTACATLRPLPDVVNARSQESNASLLNALEAFTKVRRDVDAVLADLSGEIARRSTPDAGTGGLAKTSGFANPESLVAKSTGGSKAEARRLIKAGAAAEGSDRGDDLGSTNHAPTRMPHLRAALRAGDLSIEACNVISSMLDRAEERANPQQWREAERTSVERAHTLSLEHLSRFVRQLEAQLDAESVRATEEALKNDRYLVISEDSAGAIMFKGRLDPETAAPIIAAVDALITSAFRHRRDNDPQAADTRNVSQIRADALADICRHALGCAQTSPALAKTTVIVRLSLADLESGNGSAEIDGLSQPISVSAARRMAADGEIIPIVLGGHSEVLDLGRARRPFSAAQRIALGERDGGCAWCGAPPSFTEAHHIQWWVRDHGPTNLDNGLLLCVACHHRIHRDKWEIEVKNGDVWFTPPPELDPDRTPRVGGRKFFEAPHLSAV